MFSSPQDNHYSFKSYKSIDETETRSAQIEQEYRLKSVDELNNELNLAKLEHKKGLPSDESALRNVDETLNMIDIGSLLSSNHTATTNLHVSIKSKKPGCYLP